MARIVINPTTFHNKKDALCVAFNERFRVAMEEYGWEPRSEPTEAQRRFFSDTAYATDETMLRRTIIARILTLDTSVKDPTDEQIAEALEFLRTFREREQPSNEWEAKSLDRIERLVSTVVAQAPAVPKSDRATPVSGGDRAAELGGETEDDLPEDDLTETPDNGSSLDDLFEGNRADDANANAGTETEEERRGREAAEAVATALGDAAKSGAEITGETVASTVESVINPPSPDGTPDAKPEENAGQEASTDKMGRPNDGVRRDLAGRELNPDGTIKSSPGRSVSVTAMPEGEQPMEFVTPVENLTTFEQGFGQGFGPVSATEAARDEERKRRGNPGTAVQPS